MGDVFIRFRTMPRTDDATVIVQTGPLGKLTCRDVLKCLGYEHDPITDLYYRDDDCGKVAQICELAEREPQGCFSNSKYTYVRCEV